MFISPVVAIDNGWIKGDFNADSIQPNAIDFTIDHLYSIDDTKTFTIDTENKSMRGGQKLEAQNDPRVNKNYWNLAPKQSYDGMSEFYVKVPENVACMTIIRSTLNRNGLFITSGLYDSGYEGHIGFAIHNNSGVAMIEPGTRVGQLIFVQSDSAGTYAGGYNHTAGTHHSEK